MRVVPIRVIGLQDMGRRCGTRGFIQRVILQNDRQLVLGTRQRHALDGRMRQGRLGQLPDTGLQRLVVQGAQWLCHWRRSFGRQQGQRPSRFRAVPSQQTQGIRRIQLGIFGQQNALAFYARKERTLMAYS